MKKIFLLEDAEVEKEIKELIEKKAKVNGVNDLEVVLTTVPLSLDNIPKDCDAYILHLGLVDKSYIEGILEKNPYALTYGTGGDEDKVNKIKNLLNSYHTCIDGLYANFIVDSVKHKNEKVRRFENGV